MRVYLSSPYENDRADTSWKLDAVRYMQAVDPRISFIDPCPDSCLEKGVVDDMKAEGRWLEACSFAANLVEGDLAMINNCEGVIAYFPAGARSVGTVHEVIYSLDNRVPIVFVMPEGVEKIPNWFLGLLGPHRIFDDLQDAAEALVSRMQVARGEKLNDDSIHYPGRQKASR